MTVMKLHTPTEQQDGKRIVCEETGAVVYSYLNKNNVLAAYAYNEKRKKTEWHYLFRTEAERDKYIEQYFEKKKAHKDEVKARRAARSAPHSFVVGDILCSSWGYEQTNVDFYQVVGLKGKNTILLKGISQNKENTAYGAYQVTPVVGQFTSDEFSKRVSFGEYVNMNSFSSARKWDGKPKIATDYH